MAGRAHLAHEFGAVGARHRPIENDHVRIPAADSFKAAAAVMGVVNVLNADHVQQRARHLAHGGLIVDDEHPQGCELLRVLACERLHVIHSS